MITKPSTSSHLLDALWFRQTHKVTSFFSRQQESFFQKKFLTAQVKSIHSYLLRGLKFSASRFYRPFSTHIEWSTEVDEARLLIAPLKQGVNGGGEGRFLTLRHPKTGKRTCYLLNDKNLHEIHWFRETYRSWFLGDYVCEDGSLYAATPVDPIFILIPIFLEASLKMGNYAGKFRMLEEILHVEGYPDYVHLHSICETFADSICEIQGLGSTKYFRIDDSKVLAWSYSKVCRLLPTFPSLGPNYAAQDEKSRIADAVAMLGEYMTEKYILKDLCQRLRLDARNEKMKVELTETPPSILQSNQGNDRAQVKTNKSTREVKKLKVETNSQNIKDMFTRASRKK